jgi:hypothetical protein
MPHLTLKKAYRPLKRFETLLMWFMSATLLG